MDKEKLVKKSKSISFQITLILFIILNIIDFANLFSKLGAFGNDLDIFKKILSWLLIGYLFFKASPTNIFYGTRFKILDINYILAFSLMVIPKALTIIKYDFINSNLLVFNFLFFWKEDNLFMIISFFIGLIWVLILNYIIYSKKLIYSPNSFLGSFQFSAYQKFIKLPQIIFMTFPIFFCLTVFNLFMEWFAISVDAALLVFGAVYYLYQAIKKKKTGSILNNIANSGSNFFQNIISMFSNKKTIGIGFIFILTLHPLVDLGVFIIPYSIGTDNTLYFDTLSSEDRLHTPLFNIISSTDQEGKLRDTMAVHDLENANGNFFFIIFTFLIYFATIFLATLFLAAPLLFFSRNLKQEKIEFSKSLSIIIIVSILLYTFTAASFSGLDSPISMPHLPNSAEIQGVDLFTSQLFIAQLYDKGTNQLSLYGASLLVESSIILALIVLITILLIIKYNELKEMLNLIIKSLIRINFLAYILIFLFTTTFVNFLGILAPENPYEEIYFSENISKYEQINNFYQNKYLKTNNYLSSKYLTENENYLVDLDKVKLVAHMHSQELELKNNYVTKIDLKENEKFLLFRIPDENNIYSENLNLEVITKIETTNKNPNLLEMEELILVISFKNTSSQKEFYLNKSGFMLKEPVDYNANQALRANQDKIYYKESGKNIDYLMTNDNIKDIISHKPYEKPNKTFTQILGAIIQFIVSTFIFLFYAIGTYALLKFLWLQLKREKENGESSFSRIYK